MQLRAGNAPRLYCINNILLGLAVTTLFPRLASAEDNYFDLTLEQLLDINVSIVSKKQEAMATAPAAIYVITGEDIQRSGITTIPDALRMVPGLNVAQSDSNSWAISARGFNSVLANKLLVLLDGRTLYNPVFGGVMWEAHDVVLDDIERIEVVRGPGGTLWGANAVNGVINIITKHAADTQGKLITVKYGEEEQGTLSVRQGGEFADNAFYRVYAKAFERDSLQKASGTDNYDDWNGINAGFRLDWDDNLSLDGGVYQAKTRQRKENYSLVAPYVSIENQTIVYQGANIHMGWSEQDPHGTGLNVQSFIDWTKRDEPFNFIDERITIDMDVQYNWFAGQRQELTVGAGFRFNADTNQGNNNVEFTDNKRRNRLFSAFVQDKIALSPEQWFVTLGAKFEHNDFSGFEIQPNIRLQWIPNEQHMLWAAISEAVRTPTPIEQELTSTIATAANVRLAFVPNPDFKSEQLTAYELGYRAQLASNFSMDVTGFYNDYDALQSIRVGAPYMFDNGVDPAYFLLPVKFTNGSEAQSEGFETLFDWMLSPDLKLSLNYSYLHLNQELTEPQSGDEQLVNVYPQHKLAMKVFWNVVENWTIDTTASFVDDLQGTNVEQYSRVDINIGGQLTDNIRLNLTAQNLFDSAHREFGDVSDLNSALVEQSVFAKLTFSY
ncbi:TonB-dependent receptor plug domain-containing protein [Neptunicella sp. SCSIO 80796]|uniref:TonB-dependent receptor plug domain-containing protein n=1 Tax=Neptunicella plasticusilytica TaxID=3117012 RepID=UPI003A4E0D8A